MNKWVLLQPGDLIPVLKDDEFILLAMSRGGILRVMFRFVKNIRGNIAGYLIHDQATASAHDFKMGQLGSTKPTLFYRQQPTDPKLNNYWCTNSRQDRQKKFIHSLH